MRIKRGITASKRHRKILNLAKGYRGGRSKLIKQAKEAVIHAGADSYRARKQKKHQMRSLSIVRLAAALKNHNLTYSQFIHELKEKNIELNRQVLSQIAIEDPDAFKMIVKGIV